MSHVQSLHAKPNFQHSQSFGLLIFSPWAVLYPVRLAHLRYTPHPTEETIAPMTSPLACLGGGSLPIVVTAMAPMVHTLLLSLDLYLPLVDCLLEWQHLAIVAAFAWMFLILVALMPLMG
jgi:hypothetical protein